MKKIFFLILSYLCLGCQESKKDASNVAEISNVLVFAKSNSGEGKTFEMYTRTELALLMQKMYADQSRIKSAILKDKSFGEYNPFIEKIKSAKMTEPSDDDAFYQRSADLFILGQKKLFNEDVNLKENFNNGVSLCIQCHQKKCLGPITRIKKLYISK
ncbi:MAG: hypothetical protein ACI9XR_001255 [Flavobacterium sp.]|jgi:hypothetical protein